MDTHSIVGVVVEEHSKEHEGVMQDHGTGMEAVEDESAIHKKGRQRRKLLAVEVENTVMRKMGLEDSFVVHAKPKRNRTAQATAPRRTAVWLPSSAGRQAASSAQRAAKP